MFIRPDHLEPSSWLEHLPFVFWLFEVAAPARAVTLGARKGSPHLTFCQAVNRLELHGECLLVADHKSPDAEDVLTLADRRYGALSRDLRVDPRRAAKQIEPGSVDLLALDLDIDDEDMEDVLDRWIDRVSERGIVLIPGINRHEPGCLAHEQFAKLQMVYRSITFHHGDGLGVVMVGERLPELLETLISRWSAPTAARTVREVFARLGRACADQVLADQQTARLRSADAQVETLIQDRDDRAATVAHLTTQLESRDEALKSLESDKLHLAEELADAQGSAHSLQTELAQLQTQLSEKGAALHAAEHRSQGLEAQIAERDRNIQTRFEDIATLTQMSEAASLERDQLQTDLTALEARLTEVTASLTQAESEKTRLEGVIAERDENIQTRFRELATMTNIAEEADRQQEYYKQRAEVYNQRNEDKKVEMKELRKLRDKLTRQLENTSALSSAEGKRIESELQQAKVELDSSRAEVERLRTYAHEKEAEKTEVIARLQADFDRRTLEAEQLRTSSSEREARDSEVLMQLEARLASAKKDKKSTERDLAELKKLLKKREKSLASRFDELGDLTAAMEEKDRELQSLREQLNPTPAGDQARARKSGFAGGRLPLPGLGAKSEKRREQLRQRKRQEETIAEVESSELFDGQWYLKQYPDLANDADYASKPALHYLKFGGFEGRNPSPHFDSAGYLEAYPDVALTGINPLLHYIRDGIKEGREPRPQ
ncbi:hypothetical protein [Salinicola halophilus]|uniref:hypothetical protein n=1 Tax=Salinicola halophilus TaxID=184065 RepID=UPI000DA16A85|nr:hypothetical protein [Salinicola halophilus]